MDRTTRRRWRLTDRAHVIVWCSALGATIAVILTGGFR